MISRLLKSGGSVLLSAKILVISRLLHSKLSKRQNPLPYLETLRNRLAKLRRKLLARIDRRFKAPEVPKDTLIEAMCAFALATSSSPLDVVRHFHHLRLATMAEFMVQNSQRHNSMLQALRLYVQTLKDTQALVPGQLAHALEKLKAVPIFKTQDLHGLLELNLDVHERWIGDDIKTFTPYIRHDDLSRAEAERLLKQWARTAISRFLDGLKGSIEDIQDPVQLSHLRKEVLQLWLSQHHHSLGIDSAETLDGLRSVFNNQAVSITMKRVSSLEEVGTSVRKIIEDWHEGESDVVLSLWDLSINSMDIANGGKQFCETITDRLQGRNEPLRTVSATYTRWLNDISEVENTIKSLRVTKWDDIIDDLEDDDELLDNKQVLLSEDDPQALQDELSSSLMEAYTRLEHSLEPGNLFPDEPMQGPKAVFILRVWRDFRHRLPGSYRNPDLGLRSLSKLMGSVVESALEAPLKSCSNRLRKVARCLGLTARPLWEGSPELPVLPSPWAYRLLLELMQSMTGLGADIWSPHLARELKHRLSRDLNDLLQRNATTAEAPEKAPALKVNGYVNGETNGEGNEVHGEDPTVDDDKESAPQEYGGQDETSTEKANGTHVKGNGSTKTDDGGKAVRDKKVQRLFDVLYLLQASSTSHPDKQSGGDLEEVQAFMETDLNLEAQSLERMRKDAGEYWKRTKLLFALLQE